jgi:hypothetical protein
VAPVVEYPGFKPQYHQKRKKNKQTKQEEKGLEGY